MKPIFSFLILFLLIGFLPNNTFAATYQEIDSKFADYAGYTIDYNTNVTPATSTELSDAGLIDVTSAPYNADPTGQRDSTAGIQQAINDAYDNSKAAFLPNQANGSRGIYKISNSLDMIQLSANHLRNHQAPVLIGSNRGGKKPVLYLVENAPGFNSNTIDVRARNYEDQGIKSVLMIIPRCPLANAGENGRDPEGCLPGDREETPHLYKGKVSDFDVGFAQGVRNINIYIGASNKSAVGINIPGAQTNFVEDVEIYMEDGFAGIIGAPGVGSVLGQIKITGGEYGIYFQRMDNPTFTDLTLINQEKYAIWGYARSSQHATFVGLRIVKPSTPVIRINGTADPFVPSDPEKNRNPGRGSMLLLDASFEIQNSSSTPVIENPNKRNFTLLNGYFKNVTKLASYGTNLSVNGDANWKLINEYSASADGNTKIFINNQEQTTMKEVIGTVTSATPVSDLLSRHRWGFEPSGDVLLALSKQSGSGVCNIKTRGAQGNDTADDASAIQSVFNDASCTSILFPKGTYAIKQTLNLPANKRLFGIAHMNSAIKTHDAWVPQAVQTPLIKTASNKNAGSTIFNITLLFHTGRHNPAQSWFTAMEWDLGRKSILKSLHARYIFSQNHHGSKPVAEVHFKANGGGRWFGANSHGGNVDDLTANQFNRKMLVENTTEPLILYNLNIEDGKACFATGSPIEDQCNINGWQMEMRNAENVLILGNKNENASPWLIKDSNNIAILGGTGFDSRIGSWDSTNVLIANMITKAVNNLTKLHDSPHIRVKQNGQTVLFQDDNWGIGYYRSGNPDLSKFNIGGPPTSPVPTYTPVPGNCSNKFKGDANCQNNPAGNAVDLLDYALWYSEFIGGCSETALAGCGGNADGQGTTMDANFNFPGSGHLATDMRVNVFDYAVWIQGFVSQETGSTPTPTVPVVGTATPTPTGVIPTATRTPTPTGVLPTATRTPTPGQPGQNEIVIFNAVHQHTTNGAPTPRYGFFPELKLAGTDIPGTPPSWTTPKDYYNGMWHFRYKIISSPAQAPGRFQVCIWNMPGFQPETCGPQLNHTGTVGQVVTGSAAPVDWWKLHGTLSMADQTPLLIRSVLRGPDGCPVTNYPTVNGRCENLWNDLKEMRYQITIVAVPQGQTFSGWQNYP